MFRRDGKIGFGRVRSVLAIGSFLIFVLVVVACHNFETVGSGVFSFQPPSERGSIMVSTRTLIRDKSQDMDLEVQSSDAIPIRESLLVILVNSSSHSKRVMLPRFEQPANRRDLVRRIIWKWIWEFRRAVQPTN